MTHHQVCPGHVTPMPGEPRFARLAVVGLGYMGGSLALAARRFGVVGSIVGYDPSAEALRIARARGIIDEAAASVADAARGASLLVLGGPVRSTGSLAAEAAATLPADAFVLDIGSVKAPVLAALEATSLAARFVGCHPLAGTEASGTAAADGEIFFGKPCFLCPGATSSQAAIAAASAFWESIGSAALCLDAATHDIFMAAASHLPHVAAFALAGALADEADLLLTHTPPSAPPTSLRDTTRVAASSPVVWRDIFLANREHLLPLVASLEQRIAELRRSIEAGDAAALEALLASGRAFRERVVPTKKG